MLWACQITTAKISWGLPKSICTHCGPFRRKMMLWSDASLSPSTSLARLSAGAFFSPHGVLTLGSRAMFFRPAGTIIGARGLSEIGSTLGPSCRSLGVPLKAGAGSLMASGTRSPVGAAGALGESAAGKVWARRRFRTATARPDSSESVMVRRSGLHVVFILFVIRPISLPKAAAGYKSDWQAGHLAGRP